MKDTISFKPFIINDDDRGYFVYYFLFSFSSFGFYSVYNIYYLSKVNKDEVFWVYC